jgi:hypothetical protein
MHHLCSAPMIAVAAAFAAISAGVSVGAEAQAQALKTPWGEPDLQGIWTDETDTPLQRSPKYASQEFFTEAQRAELDRESRRCSAATAAWSAAPSLTLPAPTMHCSFPRNTPARVHP